MQKFKESWCHKCFVKVISFSHLILNLAMSMKIAGPFWGMGAHTQKKLFTFRVSPFGLAIACYVFVETIGEEMARQRY